MYEYLTSDGKFSFIAKIYECDNNRDARTVFGKIEYNLSYLAGEVYSSTQHGYPGFEVVFEKSMTQGVCPDIVDSTGGGLSCRAG